jgi:hypothetical protein
MISFEVECLNSCGQDDFTRNCKPQYLLANQDGLGKKTKKKKINQENIPSIQPSTTKNYNNETSIAVTSTVF